MLTNHIPPITVLHVTSCWLEKLEIFLAIEADAAYLVSCETATGKLGMLSPFHLTVENRDHIMSAISSSLSADEIRGPVAWCCSYNLVTSFDDEVARLCPPLDAKAFAVGSADRLSEPALAAIRQLTFHHKESTRHKKPVRIRRVRVRMAAAV